MLIELFRNKFQKMQQKIDALTAKVEGKQTNLKVFDCGNIHLSFQKFQIILILTIEMPKRVQKQQNSMKSFSMKSPYLKKAE